jgi:hypothetical protein
MFLTELQPLVKELIEQPIALLGGFVSGMLKLNLSEDPLKSWLQKQGLSDIPSSSPSTNNSNQPQSIAID